MTIEGFCKDRHVSKATIYRRLKDAGITLDSLRSPSGELTTEAIQILAALTDKTRTWTKRSNDTLESFQENASNTVCNVPDTVESGVSFASIIAENVSLKRELAETRSKLDEANNRIAELLQQAAERAEQHAQAMQRIAERTQELQLLTAHAGPDRPGFWNKLKATFRRKDT